MVTQPSQLLPALSSYLMSLPLENQLATSARITWLNTARPNQITPKGDDWYIWLINAGRGFGKALSLDTMLPTVDGWTTMGTVQDGMTLFDERGMPCRVVKAHPVQIGRPCYEVEFSDGSRIVADEDHLWLTEDRRTRKAVMRRVPADQIKRKCGASMLPRYAPSVRTTAQIAATLHDGNEINHAVRVADSLTCPERFLPVPPYTLGAWLGDGTSKSAEITGVDREVFDRIMSDGFELVPYAQVEGKAPRYGIRHPEQVIGRCATTGRIVCSGTLVQDLRALGVLGNKHIPATYLRASEEQRLALLHGLMDTDGSCSAQGHCEFTSIRRDLAYGFHELAISLGIKATISEGEAKLNGRYISQKWRVTFTTYRPVFSVRRKALRQHSGKAQADRQRRRYIVAVRPVPSVPVRCITVDSLSRLYLAGRSMIPTHNTRAGAEDVAHYGMFNPGVRVAIVAPTFGDGRDICIEGDSGLLKLIPKECIRVWNRSLGELILWNDSRYDLYSADEPERLRGPQHNRAWVDELAAWCKSSGKRQAVAQQYVWDMLEFGLRLGEHPQVVVTTTPKPVPLVKWMVKQAGGAVVMSTGSTFDNAKHLASRFLDRVRERYEGTRLGRQELYAEVLDDFQGALWTYTGLEESRVDAHPHLNRIVVAVDPSGAADSNSGSDAIGIVAVGLGVDGHIYVLEDVTLVDGPAGWARAAVALYRKWKADLIVAEVNYGGAMVVHTIKSVDQNVPVKVVTASRGKSVRAEPVAALWEQGKGHMVGLHKELEDELVAFTLTGYQGSGSPDRGDAMVWAASELMDGTFIPVVEAITFNHSPAFSI